MTNKKIQTRRFLTAWLLALVVAVTLLGNASTVYAASVKKISSYHSKLVCGATATIKGMTGTSYKYTSSNKKVATINKSGKIKALRLGVTNITVKKGNTKKEYELTVIPKKASDIRVSRNIFLYGEKTKIKIVSDKYDTSQIKPEFFSSFEELSENGKWDGTADEEYECSQGGISYFYGSFEGEAILYVISPESLCNNLSYGINAGEEHENKIKLSSWDEESPTFLPSEFLENGISIELNGEQISDVSTFLPGSYHIKVSSGRISHEKDIAITYDIPKMMELHDATGYPEDKKEVLDHVFSAVESIITDGMTDREKVKAIHDYLIYNANYYNNGDYSNAPGWVYSAKGVLVNKEGVCNSYALAFCMMAAASGLDCKIAEGKGINSDEGHAWNRVCVDGTWYYVDCTWDDPVGGGYEGYNYFMSENLWSDHFLEEEHSILDDGKKDWDNYYITGDYYDRILNVK